MKKLLTLAILALMTSFASFGQISGPDTLCLHNGITLMDSTSGGTWSSSDSSVAMPTSITSSGGVSYAYIGGFSVGTAVITYVVSSTVYTHSVTVLPSPSPVTVPPTLCIGSCITLTDATTGGLWSVSPSTVATIGPATGTLCGVSPGAATIYYTLPTGCSYVTTLSIGSAGSVGTLTGPSVVCAGSTITLIDSASAYTGGTWTSSNTAVASVAAAGSTSGTVGGISPGSSIISYGLSAACGTVYLTHVVTVGSPVSAISGGSSLCAGSTLTLSDATSGGTWSCSPSFVATISGAGVVTGVGPGTALVAYTVPGGCTPATLTLTVTGTPSPILTGPTSVCVGSSITISDSTWTTGGTWTSSNPAIASVVSAGGALGTVYGISLGSAIISYAVAGSCGTVYGTMTITVGGTTTTGTISGASSVMVGSTATLYETVGGGVWSSSATSIASINSATGVVTGVAPGSAIISYAVTGCGGLAYATTTITVTAFTGISGNIYFGGAPYYGPVKVWLIHLAYPMLSALDSMTVFSTGASAFYQFTGSYASDSIRVKAAIDTLSTAAYVPTYHSSSFYWNSATVFYHTSGVGDINKNINMISGTPSSGPGFISGNVLTGANRGTSGGIPVVGLKMYLVNASMNVISITNTDAIGNYTFSGLAAGTYVVFPDSLNFLTTPFSGITLTSAAPSMSAASFIQHTISHTITPVGTIVNNVVATKASVAAFPNPTNGKLNIAWSEPALETATVIITDVAGRTVSNVSIEMEPGNGMKQVDLSNLNDGLYLINIKSASVNYNNKLQIQH